MASRTIDVDIGGTFTDCYVTWDGRRVIAKTPTTTYDLSVGFLRAIKDAAGDLGITFRELLEHVALIRYSTTVAMNKLIERKGPNLALITTAGFEDVIYVGRGSQWADGLAVREQRDVSAIAKPEPLIERHMVLAAKERVDSRGAVVRPLDEEDFLRELDHLVGRGPQGFVVSLLWSFINPVHEQRIRELIEEEYPEAYLGSMPIMLSSEFLTKRFEYSRTITTILNAYLHRELSDEITNIREELRGAGYHKPLMLVHNTGGMADAFRTTAVNTYNGGPVAGLVGSAHLGRLYGFDNCIYTDMGGTSFDVGLIVEGSTRFYRFKPTIDRWQVDLTMMETKSIGAGGGSIAWINEALGTRLEVGPQSAGSNPGPVAYNQGGTEPTVTDADVVLGYINPEFFHQGRMKLNRDRAERAIRRMIAQPLGLEPEEAALLIKRVVNARMGDTLYKETVLRGYDPADFILFASGGAGPTHACWFGFRSGVEKIVVFPFSPVFGAFGSSTMDVVHVHEQSRRVVLLEPESGVKLDDWDRFNTVVDDLQDRARLDIVSAGLDPDEVIFSLELDMRYGGQLNIKRIASPVQRITAVEGIDAIVAAFAKEYGEAFSPLGVYAEAGVEVENFALRSRIPLPDPVFEVRPIGSADPSAARKGDRPVFWQEFAEYAPTPIFDDAAIVPGNIVEGPAILEAPNTTVVIPPGRRYERDRYNNGIIE